MPDTDLNTVIEATSMGGYWRTAEDRQELELLIDRFLAAYARRQQTLDVPKWLPPPLPPMDRAALIEVLKADARSSAPAFLQALASGLPTEILVMVWLLLHREAHILELELSYRYEQQFAIRVVLGWPDLHEALRMEFSSDDVFDAATLRHMGIMKVDDRPILDGFYATRLD